MILPPQAGVGQGVPTVLLGEGSAGICVQERAPELVPGMTRSEAGRGHTGKRLEKKPLVFLQFLFVIRDFGT